MLVCNLHGTFYIINRNSDLLDKTILRATSQENNKGLKAHIQFDCPFRFFRIIIQEVTPSELTSIEPKQYKSR